MTNEEFMNNILSSFFKAMEEESINSIEKRLNSIEEKVDDIDILVRGNPNIKSDQNFKSVVIDCMNTCKENLGELELVMDREIFEEFKERQKTIWIRFTELIGRLGRYIEN